MIFLCFPHDFPMSFAVKKLLWGSVHPDALHPADPPDRVHLAHGVSLREFNTKRRSIGPKIRQNKNTIFHSFLM